MSKQKSIFLSSETKYRDIIWQANRAEKNIMYTLYELALIYMKMEQFDKGKTKIEEAFGYLAYCQRAQSLQP